MSFFSFYWQQQLLDSNKRRLFESSNHIPSFNHIYTSLMFDLVKSWRIIRIWILDKSVQLLDNSNIKFIKILFDFYLETKEDWLFDYRESYYSHKFQIMKIPIIIKLNPMTSAMRVSKSPSGFSILYSGCIGYPHSFNFSFFNLSPFL